VESGDRDWLTRLYAFAYLDRLSVVHGDVLPWTPLHDGLEVHGRRITLISARGIWKPAGLDLPISITTSPRDPYGDIADEHVPLMSNCARRRL
jgi:putative restriction endonuclease